ncbi:MAG: GGDEF domain-containing phosphodiesterase [Campylobacterota bacterium]|nr:GGDEF domain-containing phosphodiesterase [Campylobacterota bacterium]
MNIQNRIKMQTVSLSIVVLFISWIIGNIFLTYQFENSLDKQFQNITISTKNMFNLNIKDEEKRLKNELDKIANLDGLVQAMVQKDRKKINSIISSLNYNINVTLDSIDKNRKLSGFKITKKDVNYKVTKVVFYENKFVGNIEISISSKVFLKDLSSVFNIDTGIVLDKTINEKEFILFNANEKLKHYFQFKKYDEFDFYKVDMDKSLLNDLSESSSYLVIGYDMSDMAKKNSSFMYELFFIGLFVAIFLLTILHIGFNRLFKDSVDKAYTDILTGLKNREALNDYLNIDDNNVLIINNIKEFSLLNEYYGLDVANEVLKQVADGFKKFALKHNMKVYRISSDEYVLLSNNNRLGVIECTDILEELHEFISSLNIILGGEEETLRVEIYSGVSFNGEHPLEEAQIALRESKVKALPYLAYAQNLDNKIDTKIILDMKRVIRHAIEHKNVIPFFQPITNEYGEFIKYEALVRILDFENGNEKVLYPDDFLPVAIRSGLYVDLAKEMLVQSLNFFQNREEKISVNFLPNDFYNHEIMDKFIDLVQHYERPERIVVEITEQEGVGDFERLFKIVRKLRKIGVLIAIDDFGSGYANYVHILQLKPDYLKIDGSLIKDILTNEDSQILVKSITRFAGYMKIKTIAEYVENEEIFELLKTYGVDEFQGYYFGRPLNLMTGPNIF